MHNHRHLRRSVGLASAVVAATLVLGACSSAGSSGSSSKVLTVFFAQDAKPGLDAAIKTFEAAHKGVTVQVTWASPDNQFAQMRTLLAAGKMADVFQVWPGNGNVGAGQVLAADGYLANLDGQPWVKELPKSIYNVSTSKPDGQGYVDEFITNESAFGVLYNKSAVKASGLQIPKTWSQVIPFCKAALKKGVTAFAVGAATDPFAGVPAPYAMIGTTIYNSTPSFDSLLATGKATFPNSGWKPALDMYMEMVKAGCYNSDLSGAQETEAYQLVKSGKALGLPGIGLQIDAVSNSPSNVTFAPLPATNNPSDVNITIGGQEGLAVNAHSPNQTLAKEFIATVATAKQQLIWTSANPGEIPVLTSPGWTPPKSNQFWTAVWPFRSKAGPFPDQYWPAPEVQQALVTGMESALVGRETVPQVLQAMQNQYNTYSKKS